MCLQTDATLHIQQRWPAGMYECIDGDSMCCLYLYIAVFMSVWL